MNEHTHSYFMNLAIEEARKGIHAHDGGPFCSIIVKNGEIIGRGHNMVLLNHDPTAHGEISAIRDAGKNIGSHDLSGSVIYTTGEPCPMCLCACMWANISRIYFGCTIAENDRIGFRDKRFETLLGIGRQQMGDFLVQIEHDACVTLFDEYLATTHEIY